MDGDDTHQIIGAFEAQFEQLGRDTGWIVPEEPRRALLALGGITGEFRADDLLDEVFSRCCIDRVSDDAALPYDC